MRAHAEWKVMTHIARVRRPTSDSTRSRISCAALLVKVIARIWPGCTAPDATRWAIRCVSTRVLPEPAPARISSGPPGWSTASRWGSFRPSRNDSGAVAALTRSRIDLCPAVGWRPMGLCDEVREHCAEVAASARFVTVDMSKLGAIAPAPPPVLDPERHYLEGSREDVAAYLLALDTINFGSGWFPTLRKRPGCSGYYTVSWALADRFRAHGPWSGDELRRLDPETVAVVLGQEPRHELMGLYAAALRQLGEWLAGRPVCEVLEAAAGALPASPEGAIRGSAERL